MLALEKRKKNKNSYMNKLFHDYRLMSTLEYHDISWEAQT